MYGNSFIYFLFLREVAFKTHVESLSDNAEILDWFIKPCYFIEVIAPFRHAVSFFLGENFLKLNIW